ncbi:MAG TPA: glutamyl-tRNA reductase [Armatimonadota bacterium]|nr:glutamyl-tRNA reductase [Armatimonadota bacterium]
MIVLVGLNHTTAPLTIRERLYVRHATQGRLLHALCALPGVDEAVVLSTCNRTEVYAVASDLTALVNALADWAGIGHDALLAHLYLSQGTEVARHLFRVAAGLDSLVVGETQILWQVADALAMAAEYQAAGRHLSPLFQHAVAAGKRARAETSISDGTFSIGGIAVELARSLFTDLAGRSVLVLGAGKMSELSAKHLAAHGAAPIYVANRTPDHARAMAENLGAAIIAFTELTAKLGEVDIVLSSTGAPHIVLPSETVERAMRERPDRPLFLIDIAVPRDIDPAVADIPNVHLYNIDDLDAVAERCCRMRQDEMPGVEVIVSEEVERWRQRQAGLDAAPVICALRDAFEATRQAELARMAGTLATLSPEQRAAVDLLTTSLVNKLLHTPTVHLKALLSRERQALPLVCELFNLSVAADEEDDA